jgi:hypothetical protein
MTCLEVSKAVAWNEAWASANGCDCSEEIKDMQCWDEASIELCGRLSVMSDSPVVDVEEQAEKLLSKEIAVVGMMEIDSVGGEDAGKVHLARMKRQIWLGRIQCRQNLTTSVFAWFTWKQILQNRNGASVDSVIQQEVWTVVS